MEINVPQVISTSTKIWLKSLSQCRGDSVRVCVEPIWSHAHFECRYIWKYIWKVFHPHKWNPKRLQVLLKRCHSQSCMHERVSEVSKCLLCDKRSSACLKSSVSWSWHLKEMFPFVLFVCGWKHLQSVWMKSSKIFSDSAALLWTSQCQPRGLV